MEQEVVIRLQQAYFTGNMTIESLRSQLCDLRYILHDPFLFAVLVVQVNQFNGNGNAS